jgi:hypothetical protein
MATPVDYTEMGAMVARPRTPAQPRGDGRRDRQRSRRRSYSGFYMLAPTAEVAQKATLLENSERRVVEGFQAMATWPRDHVPFPGRRFVNWSSCWSARTS